MIIFIFLMCDMKECITNSSSNFMRNAVSVTNMTLTSDFVSSHCALLLYEYMNEFCVIRFTRLKYSKSHAVVNRIFMFIL